MIGEEKMFLSIGGELGQRKLGQLLGQVMASWGKLWQVGASLFHVWASFAAHGKFLGKLGQVCFL